MKDSKAFEQSFNAQTAVESKSQLIVATEVTNCASDATALVPMIEQASANTEHSVEQALADAGYRSEENFIAIEEAGIDGYISTGRESKAAKRSDRPATARMQEKLATSDGRDLYRKRKHVVEPVFGWIKNVLGFRAFSLRGLPNVDGEWNLVCIAINLRRMRALMP